MVQRYSVGSKKASHWKRLVIIAVLSLLIFGGIVAALVWEARKGNSVNHADDEAAAGQVAREYEINEEFFSMTLPEGWRETSRSNTKKERSITWQASSAPQGSGQLKLYIDTIPTSMAVTKLLPLTVAEGGLASGQISSDCGGLKGAKPKREKPQQLTWKSVKFLCDVPGAQAKIGTGTKGAINTTTVPGKQGGKHKYFFVYSDESAQSDSRALIAAISSFQAK